MGKTEQLTLYFPIICRWNSLSQWCRCRWWKRTPHSCEWSKSWAKSRKSL